MSRDYKYYVVDIGFRNYLLGRRANVDMGRALENIVYLELIRRGYKVFVGKFQDLEVDFVAEKNGEIEYYQVALSTLEKGVLDRELKILKKISDNYKKTLLTLDFALPSNIDGINKMSVVEWLREPLRESKF